MAIAFPFSILPITTGGALRGYHLLRELARRYNVEAILIDNGAEVYEAIVHDLGSDLRSLKITSLDSRIINRGLIKKLADRLLTFRLSGFLENQFE